MIAWLIDPMYPYIHAVSFFPTPQHPNTPSFPIGISRMPGGEFPIINNL
jgi:hypothetical protein